MLKILARLFVVVLILLLSVEVAYAAVGKSFGGKITKLKAPEIAEAEELGFKCDTTGSTIQVYYKKSYKSYFIPNTVKSRTRHQLKSGQSILGAYNGQTIVFCNKEPKNEDETRETKSFRFDKITIFGTSRI